MSRTPYDDVPPIQRWSSLSKDIARGVVDAQGGVRFTIEPQARIASAGIGFAAPLAQELRTCGTQYFVTEQPPKWLGPEREIALGYRPFSARFGSIYTVEQLRQLFARAFGTFVPVQEFWERDGRYIDPFRPRTTPDGYGSVEELIADRERHLSAVRRMFSDADVFLFTLGRTESWRDRADGAVYPYGPGIAGGSLDSGRYEFHNSRLSEVVDSLHVFIMALREVNPNVRLILSLSPVPLGATMEPVHIVRATTYSKSVLRVAAQEICDAYSFVDYFAAYEMVSQSFFGCDPFTEDRRHLRAGIIESIVKVFRSYYLQNADMPQAQDRKSIVIEEVVPCDEDIFAR
jgi:hypothetical protein